MPRELHLRAGDFDPLLETVSGPKDLLLSPLVAAAARYHVVQFTGRDYSSYQRILKAAGLEVLEYIPDGAYLVRGSAGAVQRLADRPEVRWTGAWQPLWRLEPQLLEHTSEERVKLLVILFPEESSVEVLQVLDRRGARLLARDRSRDERIKFSVSGARVPEVAARLARIEGVRWVGRAGEFELCNDNTVIIGQSGLGGSTTPIHDAGIRGEGQIVAFADTGVDYDMCYFYDSSQGAPGESPNPAQRKLLAYHVWAAPNDWDGSGTAHGTHVCGTLAGDDFAHPLAHDTGDGMAPGAKVIVQDVALDDYLLGIPTDLGLLFQQAYNDGVRIHSNSWNEPYDYSYTSYSRDVDEFMWENKDFLVCFAIGNNGPFLSTIGMPGTAKNCLTVGATGGGADAVNVALYSSHGPTEDGRRKPDIVICGGSETTMISSAEGDWDVSSFNCNTRQAQGTSMATPAAAGFAALIRQYFIDGFYPSGSATSANALTPSAALIKAMLVNSGENVTGQFTGDDGYFDPPAPIPTNGQGFGRITLDKSLYLSGDSRRLWIRDESPGADSGDLFRYSVSVASSAEPLEVTLVWTDYPSSLSASTNLVNDLDLEVVEQASGTTYKGNVYLAGYSTTGGSADRLNTVESCNIANPSAGRWIIRVRGYSVPYGPQPFALVVTGDLHFSDGQLSLSRREYGCNDSITITLWDEDLAGNGVQAVPVTSTSDPAGETALLTETPPNSGYFRGSLSTTAAFPPLPGELFVADGDIITARYVDADDGLGGSEVPKVATAVADCTGPAISGVVAIDVTDTTAEIAWLTDEPADSRVYYGAGSPTATAYSDSLVQSHSVTISGLTAQTEYSFYVMSTDASQNASTEDNGGVYFRFRTMARINVLFEPLDSDPGWTISGGLWAFGRPTGQGGSGQPGGLGNPDPLSGFTGQYVYGYNLDGNYPYNSPAYTLTTPSYDCSPGSQVTLQFKRWLGVEGWIPIFDWGDQAKVEVSVDNGATWTTVWFNGESSYDDGAWIQQTIDISDLADHQSSVRLRWIMGPTAALFTLPL